MTMLGATCMPQVPPERLREVARAAEDAGLDELWLWEDCFWGGGVSAASAVLAWTSRLRVGIGVLIDEGRTVAGRTDHHSLVVYRPAAGGDAAAVAGAVRSWTVAGVDTLVLHPTLDDPDPVGFVRFVAEQIRPLLGP